MPCFVPPPQLITPELRVLALARLLAREKGLFASPLGLLQAFVRGRERIIPGLHQPLGHRLRQLRELASRQVTQARTEAAPPAIEVFCDLVWGSRVPTGCARARRSGG